jgi:hypothetical protein
VVSETIGLFRPGDLKVERFESTTELEFDSVHSMETPKSWFAHPVVVQFVYSPNKNKVFGRATVCLQYNDGVSGFHTIFNVMEYFEHMDSGASPEIYLTKPGFRNANPAVSFDPAKMDAHVKMLESTAEPVIKNDDDRLPVGISRAKLEDSLEPRVWKRFSATTTTFKDCVRVSTECQKRLELPYVVYTVNYAPSVCLGRVQSIADTLDRQKRADGIFTPQGASLPMNVAHAEGLSYMFFWNNYGKKKHNPNISSRVTAAVWNWTGVPKCFTPLMWATQIHDKTFFVLSISSGDFLAVKDLVSSMDGGRNLTECPPPSVPSTLEPDALSVDVATVIAVAS